MRPDARVYVRRLATGVRREGGESAGGRVGRERGERRTGEERRSGGEQKGKESKDSIAATTLELASRC